MSPAALALYLCAFASLAVMPLLSPLFAVAGGFVTVATAPRPGGLAFGLVVMVAALVAFVLFLAPGGASTVTFD